MAHFFPKRAETRLAQILLGLLATACASKGDIALQSSLAARTLDSGECGLFLYSRSRTPEFIFFTQAGSNTAQALIDGREQSFSLSSGGGELLGQFYTEQHFVSLANSNVRLKLEITGGENLVDGRRVPLGRMIVTAQDGWQTVKSVTGVIACQAS